MPEIHSGSATLSGDDAHHLTRVLRVEKGQKYEISDNRAVYLAEVEAARRDLVTFRVIEQIEAAEAPVRVALYVALVRFERIDLLVEKATELGVERMAFFETERSERGLDRGAEKRVSRWQRIAREASERAAGFGCRRLPRPYRFKMSSRMPCRADCCWMRSLEAHPCWKVPRPLPAERTPEDRVSLMTGPEGGWTDRERAVIHDAGWRSVSLGPAILRTETAAIAARLR